MIATASISVAAIVWADMRDEATTSRRYQNQFRSLIGLAVDHDQNAGGNPIDHSRDANNRGHGSDQIRNDARQAAEERNRQEAEAAEKPYPASLVRSPQLVPG
jgi:hypothetical protein